jgi:hypothetical protein
MNRKRKRYSGKLKNPGTFKRPMTRSSKKYEIDELESVQTFNPANLDENISESSDQIEEEKEESICMSHTVSKTVRKRDK